MKESAAKGHIKDKYRILEFKEYGDERGNLVVAKETGMCRLISREYSICTVQIRI